VGIKTITTMFTFKMPKLPRIIDAPRKSRDKAYRAIAEAILSDEKYQHLDVVRKAILIRMTHGAELFMEACNEVVRYSQSVGNDYAALRDELLNQPKEEN
jgi:hypothetical protein